MAVGSTSRQFIRLGRWKMKGFKTYEEYRYEEYRKFSVDKERKFC